MRLTRTPLIFLLLTIAFAGITVGPAVWSTCGGGGGGGRGQAYQTRWVTLPDALAVAPEKKTGILIYFPPEGVMDVHPLFKTKMMAELSADRPFVKMPGALDEPLREAMDVPPTPTVVVSDWFGNKSHIWVARKLSDKFPWEQIQESIEKMPKIVKRLEKKLNRMLKKGENRLKRKKYGDALRLFGEIMEFKGYDAIERADEAYDECLVAGDEAVANAVELAKEDSKKAASALKKLVREFKDTRTGDTARDALEEIQGKKKDGDSSPEPMEPFVWVHSIDPLEGISEMIEEMASEISDLPERVTAHVHNGMEAEVAAMYEEARREYQTAVRLAPDDPVPARFLGELFRHHIGDWEGARKQFEKVVKLGGDSYSTAIALHGLGKMTIAAGEFEKGLALIEKSIEVHPTALAYRNLAVYWNSEEDSIMAVSYVAKAVALEPDDPYNRVFAAVYAARAGRGELALRTLKETPRDPSMSYNVACIYAELGDRELALTHLSKHFYEFEKYDAVRRHEMAEARSDINFRSLKDDPEFLKITSLADES
ncbi:MAG: tetratricopeptide repeat protein [Planctomycetota bacterium]|nr:tetratricopeptide repeat protein [Planctomycetota bacterium]